MKTTAKTLLATTITTLLVGCGGSKLPDPSPLVSFTPDAKMEKIWSTSATNGNEELLFKLTPAVENDVIYTAGNDGGVTAINLLNGKKIWQQHYENLSFSSNLALNGNSLYLGTDNAKTVKLDKTSGQLIWQKAVPSTVIAAPEATDHEVFVKTIDGQLTTLDTQTGKAIWNYQQTLPALTLRDASNPVIQNQLLLIGFANGTLLAFDPTSGNVLWNKQISSPEGKTDVERMADVAATPRMTNNSIIAATYQGKLTAFNLQTQDILWSIDASTYNDFTLSENALYLGDTDGNILAVDQKTGAILWKQTALLYRHLTAPTYIGNNLIAVADQEGYLHIINAKDGHFVARASVNNSGFIAPPLYVHGLLILQANDGDVYAYKISQ